MASCREPSCDFGEISRVEVRAIPALWSERAGSGREREGGGERDVAQQLLFICEIIMQARMSGTPAISALVTYPGGPSGRAGEQQCSIDPHAPLEVVLKQVSYYSDTRVRGRGIIKDE